MKQTILIIVLFFPFLILPTDRVYSVQPVAEATAQLTANSSETNRDMRADRLREYLSKFEGNFRSPLQDEADHIIREADANRIDWRLIVAIAGVESTFCQHIPQSSYNCWGWGIPTGATHGLGFRNYKEAISTISKGLRENYIDHGHNSLEKMGRVYAASPAWAYKVRFFMRQIEIYEDTSARSLDLTL